MKSLSVFTSVLGLAAACALPAANSPAPRTVVVFDHPENFTDIKDAYVATQKGQEAILSDLREYLVHVTEPLVPGGYKLTVTFTNIDLAGEYEPWHSPMYQDVRMLRDIYPPAFKFTYAVTDPAGKVVRSGSQDIRDVAYQMRVTLDLTDPLRYEKDILSEWARSALQGLKKG